MLSQYKNEGEFTIKIDDLKYRLYLIDKKKEQYEGWTNFENAVIKKPQKEINEKTDIFFVYRKFRIFRNHIN